MTESAPLWRPSAQTVADSNLTAFARHVESAGDVMLPDYWALLDWSRANQESFFQSVWDFGGIVSETRGKRALIDGDKMPGAKWFPDARLNFAENLLRNRGDGEAMVFNGEGMVSRRLSFDEVYDQVSLLVQILEILGVGEGDRVCGYLPNMPETVIAMAANLMGSLDPSKVLRINTDHYFEHMTMDTMIGRAAHVSLLDSHGFILLLFFSLPSSISTLLQPSS